jgi:hypothetical protein
VQEALIQKWVGDNGEPKPKDKKGFDQKDNIQYSIEL